MRLGIAFSPVFAALALACGGRVPRPHSPADLSSLPGDPCEIVPGGAGTGGAGTGDSVVVALGGGLDPSSAPVPHGEAERLVFRHLYETLVTADCADRIVPGLAESWSAAERGRVWTFTLRAGARFWDGTPVTAAAVARSWIANRDGERGRWSGFAWAWLAAGTDSVAVLDDRRLEVRLTLPLGESPALFADPALAVAERRPGGAWPAGTGPCRPAPGALGPDLVCLPNVEHPGPPPRWGRLVFRMDPATDLRDLDPSSVDAVVVRDRAHAGYFASAGFEDVALPWDRLYLLVASRGDSGWARDWPREELASVVVVADARPATSIRFGGDAPADSCPELAAAPQGEEIRVDWGARTRRRIAYLGSDRDARRLAERLVALSGRPDSEVLAAGLGYAGYGAALAAGGESAFVFALERGSWSCLELAALREKARWLRLEEPGAVVPLVATRPHLLVRRGLGGVRADADGTPRFERAGWADGTQDGTVPP